MELESEYHRIQKRVLEDPGTAGDQGEENWATLLREWLPRSYHVVTKGRILSQKGIASPQVDVLVLDPSYPGFLLDKKLYLAGSVAAAFECKLTLRAEHLAEAVRNSVQIRQHLPRRHGSPYKELHSPLLYGLLAHSHEWKEEKSTPIPNVIKSLLTADADYVSHPVEMLDLICVADLATWVSRRISWIPRTSASNRTELIALGFPDGAAATAYMCHARSANELAADFTPVGTMLSVLLERLAWENPELRRLSRYFQDVGLRGQSSGQPRLWLSDIYSDEIRHRVLSPGELVLERSWSEWRWQFT